MVYWEKNSFKWFEEIKINIMEEIQTKKEWIDYLEEENKNLLDKLSKKNALHNEFCIGAMQALDDKQKALDEMKVSLDKKEKELKEALYIENTSSFKRKNLLRKLETHFLIRGLTGKEIREMYGKNLEEIIPKPEEKEIIANNSYEIDERIFKIVVDIKAAEKILEKIESMKKYGIELREHNEATTLSDLKEIKKNLEEFSLQEEDENHYFCLEEVVEKKEDKLTAIKNMVQELEKQFQYTSTTPTLPN